MPELRELKEILTEGKLGWITYIVLGILMALLVNHALSVFLSTEIPLVTVKRDSMRPTMNPGDIVFIRGRDSYEPGDIVVFSGWIDTPIIHRIVARVDLSGEEPIIDRWQDFDELDDETLIERGRETDPHETVYYVTKGDNNPKCDQCSTGEPLVTEDEIYGRSILRIPYLGWVKLTFTELIR